VFSITTIGRESNTQLTVVLPPHQAAAVCHAIAGLLQQLDGLRNATAANSPERPS
jgi:hypothetical protein